MRMNKKIFFLFLCIFGLLQGMCFAHGVHHEIIKGGIGIEVKYDGGLSMAFSEIKIYSPVNKKICFQEGLTDKNGRFIFSPDREGKWKIIVQDGTGHGLVKEIDVGKGMELKRETVTTFSRWQKMLIGVSLIFGITGIMFYFVTKKQHKV